MRVLGRAGLAALWDVFHLVAPCCACGTAEHGAQPLFHGADVFRVDAWVHLGGHHLGDGRGVAEAFDEVGRVVVAFVGDQGGDVAEL